ncbi:protein FAM3C [Larimichthys crocea]|uniref:protein FAM3C n=1 Tax=Larimichthys crocea TaxID=215358 RepID=UPI00090182E2|nr:protein FAM3C [Larimichthys crocea]XP_027131610.1 protein FAM3C [Larimichthys crocea]
MARRQNFRKVWQCMLLLVPVILFITFMLQDNSNEIFSAEWRRAIISRFDSQSTKTLPKQSAAMCNTKVECPEETYGFYIQSGAANVMPPKICLQNKPVLGMVLNNAGIGINIVIVNGKTGEAIKTGHFNMFTGEVQPLIDFLKSIDKGSVVLIATYDEPASKLNDEARKLMAELGSTAIQSLRFRDSWVFVGGKGAAVDSSFEKHVKNDPANNKYENWPELIELHGCIPKYQE